nr:uncharacterized protein LOC104650547 [Saimiri boliviensis boliviensis]
MGLGGATNSKLQLADRSGPQLPAFPPRAAKPGRSFFSGRGKGYVAPPPQRTLRGHQRGVDPCTGPGVPREGPDASHTYSRRACPALLRIPNSVSGTTQLARERGKHTHSGGRRKPNPAPPQAASETHLPLPLAAGKLGAFMAPREEGSQAEKKSPLRRPSLALPLLSHMHALSPSLAAANPLCPPVSRLPTPKAPTFS